MKKCIGITSWLTDDECRTNQIMQLDNFLSQIEQFWPDINILIVAQNWKEYTPKIKNTIIRYDYSYGLGTTNARQTLRAEFLKLDFDYIIMFNTDTLIEEDEFDGTKKFIEEIDKHPDGFCTYTKMNAMAISKSLFSATPIPPISVEKSEAYEDWIFEELLNAKYPKLRFQAVGIKCTRMNGVNSILPVVSGNEDTIKTLYFNSNCIIDYIKTHKQFPNDWKKVCEKNKKKD